MIGLIKGLHLLSTAYFIGFVMLDNFVIRRFLNNNCHPKKIEFYESAKFSLYAAAAVIISSGLYMTYMFGFILPFVIVLKICLALFALVLFFSAPRIVKRAPKSVGYIYGFILGVCVCVVLLAKL